MLQHQTVASPALPIIVQKTLSHHKFSVREYQTYLTTYANYNDVKIVWPISTNYILNNKVKFQMLILFECLKKTLPNISRIEPLALLLSDDL